jgi:hypothetical protein
MINCMMKILRTQSVFSQLIIKSKLVSSSNNNHFINQINKLNRHDDLKQMLDSNKDNLKLDAMKRIIGVSKT